MLYRSRASVIGSMPHSYGSSFTLLYFSECRRLANPSVNSAKPVATTTKMAMGMYGESIWRDEAAHAGRSVWLDERFIPYGAAVAQFPASHTFQTALQLGLLDAV